MPTSMEAVVRTSEAKGALFLGWYVNLIRFSILSGVRFLSKASSRIESVGRYPVEAFPEGCNYFINVIDRP